VLNSALPLETSRHLWPGLTIMSSRTSIDEMTKGLVGLFPGSGPETTSFKDDLGAKGGRLPTYESHYLLRQSIHHSELFSSTNH